MLTKQRNTAKFEEMKRLQGCSQKPEGKLDGI